MSFDIKNDVLKIALPTGNVPAMLEPFLFDRTVNLAAAAFKEAGFEKVEVVSKPASFFYHASHNDTARLASLKGYDLVLRSSFTPYVTLEELQKHAAIINVYHDIFTHKIPTGTQVRFTPTITMVAVENITN